MRLGVNLKQGKTLNDFHWNIDFKIIKMIPNILTLIKKIYNLKSTNVLKAANSIIINYPHATPKKIKATSIAKMSPASKKEGLSIKGRATWTKKHQSTLETGGIRLLILIAINIKISIIKKMRKIKIQKLAKLLRISFFHLLQKKKYSSKIRCFILSNLNLSG